MSDLVFDDPCVLFALRRESAPFLREFRPHERVAGAPCWARFCGPAWLTVLAAETAGATDATLPWLLGAPVLEKVPYRPKLVLSAGFAAALRDDLRPGDVILATDVVDAAGQRWPTTWPGDLPPGEWRPPLHRGRVLCQPLPRAERSDALAQDWSSAAIAQQCSQRSVPFGCVRVVLAGAQEPITPSVASLLAGWPASPLHTLGAALRSPRGFVSLHRRTMHAAGQLGAALGELLTLTLPGGREL